jgi:hypothetical protein
MSLEASFEKLRSALQGLQDAVSALQVTVAEDKPRHGEAVLVDWLDNTITDLSGTLEETVCALQRAPNHQSDAQLKETRAAISRAHALIIRFTHKYLEELAAHDVISRLLEMGRERGRAWQHWVRVVKTAIDRCAAPQRTTESALLDCWHELGEQLARGSVSVQATNIGQQINLREDQLEMAG